jgi:hypothetical protein
MEKTRPLKRKKNEWVLYAFIFEKTKADRLSLDELCAYVKLFKRENSRRRVSTVLRINKSKGFELVETSWLSNQYQSFYSFNGSLPEIDYSTSKRWNEILSP